MVAPQPAQHLAGLVELGRSRQVGQIAGVHHESGRNPKVFTWLMARLNEPVTSVFAGPWKPRWLSLIWTNRNACGSCATAAAARVGCRGD